MEKIPVWNQHTQEFTGLTCKRKSVGQDGGNTREIMSIAELESWNHLLKQQKAFPGSEKDMMKVFWIPLCNLSGCQIHHF